MEDTKIFSFEAMKNTLFEAAYEWAVSEQIKFGLVAQPINLVFDKDEITFDENKVFVSLFYDEKAKRAIIRRDWDEGFVVQYNILANYEQLTRIAPKSIEKLRRNGVDLYRRYYKLKFGV